MPESTIEKLLSKFLGGAFFIALGRSKKLMNEELATKVEQILNQFASEELGNRLSQFAMLSLKEMILNEIKAADKKDEKRK